MSGFANIGKVPELRQRLLFTLGMLAVYRIGVFVTTPGVDRNVMQCHRGDSSRAGCSACSTCSRGGALEHLSIFALGIMPYVSASIILQLMTMVVQAPRRAAQRRRAGQRKINQYTRYGTIVLSALQASGIAMFLEGLNKHRRRQFGDVVREPGLGLPPDDDDHADDRHRLHHVGRRADHRARHRQRHLADHLRRHRRATCPTALVPAPGAVKIGKIQPLNLLHRRRRSSSPSSR